MNAAAHRTLVVILLAAVLAPSLVRAQAWTFEVLGPGTYFDMAVEPNGTPHIVQTTCVQREVCNAYGDDSPRYLTHRVEIGDVWKSDTLSLDAAGFTPAIALDDTGGVHIAYVDSLYQLRYIYGGFGGPWSYESPPHSSPSSFRSEPGIAVDDSGGVHISYNQQEHLWYQWRSSAGWTEEQVSTSSADNDYARSSIAIGGDGVVRIAYWESSAGGVLYERSGGVWSRNEIGGIEGTLPSLALDGDDASHILYTSYFDHVTYATNETGPWTEELLDPNGLYGDIVLTGDGTPIAVYPSAVWVIDGGLFEDVDLYVSTRVGGAWHRQSIDHFRVPGGVYGPFYYRPILAVDGMSTLHIAYTHPLTNDIRYGRRDLPVAVGRDQRTAAAAPRVRAVPNPFNPSTSLHCSVPSPGWVRLRVYDVAGRLLATLVDRHRSGGDFIVRWDGRDSSGHRVGSGVYFARLEVGGSATTSKIVLLK